MKLEYNNAEYNYRQAVNYNGTQYYNFPMSLKVNGILYIIPFGTSDCTTEIIEDKILYIIGEHSGLNYIGLFVIDTENKNTESCFLQGDDLTNEGNMSFNLLEKDTAEKLEILKEYLPY